MLFNKNNEGTEELKKHVSFLYSSTSFLKIETDVQLAEEELIKVIGQPVYDIAQTHYSSASFDPNGDSVLDKFLNHLQLPIALLAVLEYTKNTDVSHESTGRRAKIDDESEKLPFEWMLDRDSAAMLRKHHKAVDRLIAFLEKYPEETGWKDSEAQKEARSLFINNAKEFDSFYPIDESRRFYLKIIPFIKDIERTEMRAILGEHFDALKTKIANADLDDDDKTLLIYVRNVIVMKVMARSVNRFSIEVLPEGVFQPYVSEKLTTKGKIPTSPELRREISIGFEQDAKINLQNLQEYLKKTTAPDTYVEEEISVLPNNDIEHKFFRT